MSVKISIVEKYADVYCTKVKHFMWQKMMPLQERNIQGNVNGDVTPVRPDCQSAVVRESAVMLSGSEASPGQWRETLRCAQGDNRVRVV